MNINDFSEKIRNQAQQELGNSFFVETGEVRKLNGVVFHNLTIHAENVNVAPSICLDPFYEMYIEGKSINKIVKDILKIYWDNSIGESIDVSYIYDYENVKDNIFFSLCNYEKNKELLEDIPYIPFLDLAIIFSIQIKNNLIEEGSVKISNYLMGKWRISIEDIMKQSLVNSSRLFGPKCFTMYEYFMSDIPGSEKLTDEQKMLLELFKESMWIATNESFYRGASVIMYPKFLENFAEMVESNYFILPSSIDEVILIPQKNENHSYEETVSYLKSMVREVNFTSVNETDVLSDNVYYFSRSLGKVTVA